MKDPYTLLGVEKTASEDAIRSAYRKLAKKLHPDVNPGKPEAAEKFKELSQAYAILSDSEKRARFDRGEIDETGAERPQERQFYRDFGDRSGRSKYRAEADVAPEDLEEFFAQAFGRRQRGSFEMRGQDHHYTLSVDFIEAAAGAKRRLTLPDGGILDVTIPEGLRDGQTLRLKGKGGPGAGGGAAGDALIEVSVTPHKFFRREGDDIIVDLPVTLKEAVLGAKVQVPTIKGAVTLTVPPNSSTGTRLRLKERGTRGGHQYVDLKVVLPSQAEPELTEFLKGWEPKHEQNPRHAMEGS